MGRFDGPEISGDQELTVRQRIAYLLSNLRRNAARPRMLRAVPFRPGPSAPDASVSSPGRALTNLYIAQELPNLLAGRGGGSIDVLDLGCGRGSLCARLAALGVRGRYIGVDIHDRFDRTPVEGFTKTFVQAGADSIGNGAYDLIMSVSALEHFPNDRALMEQMRARVRPGGVEIHIVPSAAAMSAYLWHGYRQYSLARIEHVFGNAGVTVVRLGGLCSLAVHVVFVTVPEILLQSSLRTRWRRAYLAARRLAFIGDRALPFGGLMYVVVRRS